MALNPDTYRLSEAEHQRIFERDIAPIVFAGAKSVERPLAIIFGGQPGAGKSALLEIAARELDEHGGAVQIIGDDLRVHHPMYRELLEKDDKHAAFYTDKDSGKWVEKAIAKAKTERFNLVIEGTMRDSDTVAATMIGLRAAGYEIDARALAVNERVSWQGVLQRYEAQREDRGAGRMTAPHSHQAAYDGMPITLDRIERECLADRLALYRRGGEAIYENQLRDGRWEYPASVREALLAERERPSTLVERQAYARGFDRLHELMSKPERSSTRDEMAALEKLRDQSHRELRAAEIDGKPAADRQMP